MFHQILAKSPAQGRQITLSEHTATIRDAAGCLFGSASQPTRLGREWCRFFRLGLEQFRTFLINLQLAALFHDLGKANNGFQDSIHHQGDQVIRHEHLSALLLYSEPMWEWLSRHVEAGVDVEVVISAVVSHHLKVNDKEFAKRLIPSAESFQVFAKAPEFAACLRMASEILGSAAPNLSDFDRVWSFEKDVDSHKGPKGDFGRSMHTFKHKVRTQSSRQRLLVAVKAGLIAADSVGSALVREGESLEGWIRNCFGNDPLTPEWIEEKIIEPRKNETKKKSGRPFEWRGFQTEAAKLGERALLLSGCGTGKTLAAWHWVKAQVGRRPASRVLFLYPTRATATEGFRDYISWAGGEDAALLHSTAAYDLEGLFDNPGDPRTGGDYHVRERLFALGYWPKRVFSATADSFLAFMRNQYAPLCLLPVLADSIVVVDEVHSFDRSMFTALEGFLKFFDLPVLCMTASLPLDRQQTLRDSCGLEIFPRSPEAFADLKRQSEAPRYQLSLIDEAQALAKVREALGVGEKKVVLWVVNTVRRCQENARSLKNTLPAGTTLLCYHSRFRLSDRRDRHNDVIQGFRNVTGPVVVVTTQVCEMSLDLDADVLITEIAPVPALIQRMGRCCREPLPRKGRCGQVYIYSPSDVKPYEKQEIEQGKAFVEAMHEQQRPLTHADLADYLAKMDVSDPFVEGGYNGFLDAGPYAMSRDEFFREGDDFTVDCVLDVDIDAYLAKLQARNPSAAGFIVPVPHRFAKENARLGRYLREAPAAQYGPNFGFEEVVRDR